MYASVDQIIGLPNKDVKSLRCGNHEHDGSQDFMSGKGPESLPLKPLLNFDHVSTPQMCCDRPKIIGIAVIASQI